MRQLQELILKWPTQMKSSTVYYLLANYCIILFNVTCLFQCFTNYYLLFSITSKGKKLYFGFVDLENTFDGIPREVIRWAMHKLGAEEWIVLAVMYTGAKTVVRTVYGNSNGFKVKVGMH